MLSLCEHFVLGIVTDLPWDYLRHEMSKGISELPGVGRLRRAIESAVTRYLRVVDGIVFAADDRARESARQEVSALLREAGFSV